MRKNSLWLCMAVAAAVAAGCASSTPLIDAAFLQDYHRVVDLVKSGNRDLNAKDRLGRTPLIYAAYYSNIPILSFLAQQGAELDRSDALGNTALHYASQYDSIESVRILLEKGADPNLQNSEGNTALLNAAYNGNAGIVELLLDHGANPDIRNNRGYTPILYARQYDFDAVKAVIENKRH